MEITRDLGLPMSFGSSKEESMSTTFSVSDTEPGLGREANSFLHPMNIYWAAAPHMCNLVQSQLLN